MNKQFIPYEQALKLKELGFDEKCYAYYTKDQEFFYFDVDDFSSAYTKNLDNLKVNSISELVCTAPLWQQAFDWFLDNYGIFAETTLWGDGIGYMSLIKEIRQEEFRVVYDLGFATPNRGLPNWDRSIESLSCLNKIIEIVGIKSDLDKGSWRVLINPIEKEDFLLSIGSTLPDDNETTEEGYKETYNTKYGTYEVIWKDDKDKPIVRKFIE
jgi:hypothetical protein